MVVDLVVNNLMVIDMPINANSFMKIQTYLSSSKLWCAIVDERKKK